MRFAAESTLLAPSHIAISDEDGNVRGYRDGGDKTRVQLLKAAFKGCLFLFILPVRLT